MTHKPVWKSEGFDKELKQQQEGYVGLSEDLLALLSFGSLKERRKALKMIGLSDSISSSIASLRKLAKS